VENGTIKDLIHVIAQEVANSIGKKTYPDMGV
jgi:hypothetical protein